MHQLDMMILLLIFPTSSLEMEADLVLLKKFWHIKKIIINKRWLIHRSSSAKVFQLEIAKVLDP